METNLPWDNVNTPYMNFFEQLQRRRLMLPSVDEIIDAFASMSTQEVAVIVGVLFSLGLLCMPLSQIDRRDNTAALTYILWIIAVAVVLILALPNKMPGVMQTGEQLLLMFTFACLASIRWGMRRRFNPAIAKIDRQNKESKP